MVILWCQLCGILCQNGPHEPQLVWTRSVRMAGLDTWCCPTTGTQKPLSCLCDVTQEELRNNTEETRVMVDAAESCVLWSQSVDIPSSGWQIIINLINVLVLYRHDSSQRGLVMGQICVIHVQRRYNWSLEPSLAETLRCKDNCEGKFVLLNTDPHYFSAGGAAAKPLVHNTYRTLLFHIKPT